MTTRETRLMVGKLWYKATIQTDNQYHYIESGFALKDELKAMKGAKWLGREKENPRKVWRVDNCRRNNFNLEYLEGKFPFARYKKPLEIPPGSGFQIRTERTNHRGEVIKIYAHQIEMTKQILLRRQCIISGEMGTGKTLAVFEAIELSLVPEVWYVAPKSALASVKLEALIWRFRGNVKYFTYEELKKVLTNWPVGQKPPTFVVFDESSRVKTPTSQRSQAAMHLAESMRDAYGDKAYIVLMSGSPAPKSPLDWWMQCEIACPGYVKEGDINKFRYRLEVSEVKDDLIGVKFSKHVAWKDGNPNRCGFCGKMKEDNVHIMTQPHQQGNHDFIKMPNEIENLYRRLGGLVLVKFKKDCLDLPEKQYQIRRLKPSLDLIRAARLVVSQSRSAMQSMTLLRELSDGFQYKEEITKDDLCDFCHGNKQVWNDKEVAEDCKWCDATGTKSKRERKVVEVPSPKIDELNNILEDMEEIGRLVVYAGFTGSIDRICEHVKKKEWQFIRVDGRGWYNSMNPNWSQTDMLMEFQNKESQYEKIVFVGHPGSAGMGLTLTASPAIVYYSNDFNAESRIQSEDRIHRAGMDVNRGATIIDLVLLPTDDKVLQNLKRKRELQSISLGELKDAIESYVYMDNVL